MEDLERIKQLEKCATDLENQLTRLNDEIKLLKKECKTPPKTAKLSLSIEYEVESHEYTDFELFGAEARTVEKYLKGAKISEGLRKEAITVLERLESEIRRGSQYNVKNFKPIIDIFEYV